MNEQLTMDDLYAKPDYHGRRDEIIRLHEELQLQNRIQLVTCCGKVPALMFRDVNTHWVRCLECGRQTANYRHTYQAMQAWNRGEVIT